MKKFENDQSKEHPIKYSTMYINDSAIKNVI